MKKLSLFSLFFLSVCSLLANIRIVSTTAAAGGCNGSIQVEATGTAGPFSITLIKPDGSQSVYASFSGNKTLAGLCFGTYTVKVYNRFECAAELSATVTKQLALKDSITYNCDAAGKITIIPSGGDVPYSYSWVGPGFLYVPSQNPVNVTRSGTYSLTVTDSKGIKATRLISYQPLVSQALPTPDQINIQPSCSSGLKGGGICVNVDTSKWKIEWPTLGKTGTCVSNLNAGIYCYKLTDKACNKVSHQCVTVPTGTQTALKIVSDTSRDCSVPQNKTICASGSGGLAPYQISWSNSEGSNSCIIRSTGTRTVTITDVCNSIVTQSYNFGATFPALRIVSAEGVNNCSSTNYQFLLKASGGKGPYTYQWFVNKRYNAGYDPVAGNMNDPLSPLIPNNIGYPGPAKVIVTDACNNKVEKILTSNRLVVESLAYESVYKTENDCNSIVLGVTNALSSNGHSLFYKWNTGATTEQISAVYAGKYTLTITSKQISTGKTCQTIVNTTVPINQSSAFFSVAYVVKPSASGKTDGAIDLTVFGGLQPLLYSWGPGQPNTEDRTNLAPGTYTVYIANDIWPYCGKSYAIQVPVLSTNLQQPTIESSVSNGKKAELSPNKVIALFTSKVFPNPFERNFTLEIESTLPGRCEVVVYNVLGQVVYQKSEILEQGLNRQNIDLGSIQNQQVYYLRIRHASGANNHHKIVQARQ